MKILVLSETDACCGPMAAAFLRDYSTLLEVVSVGRNPLQSIDPMVVTVMKECLIDMSGYVPCDVKTIDASDFDVVYECPEIAYANTIEAYREMRDAIKNEAYLFSGQTFNSQLYTLNSQLSTDSTLSTLNSKL